ncbi:MAG: hypothetical protein N2Z21_01375 [Candidatus Sumerlaeaceae bacterium]|nr:hypothetical protein [Candidatus Sumerlaeaceae bacterium]
MSAKFLQVELLSDTTFSRGDGTPGIVDVEIEHDDLGLPFLGGKALRALLRDSWLSMLPSFPNLESAAARVLGRPQDIDDGCILRIGNAEFPSSVKEWIAYAVKRAANPLAPLDILESLTAIRYQTSEERTTGAPAKTTLRSSRVIMRGLSLQAPLRWLVCPQSDDLRVLASVALATRHAGLSRNRGRGHIRITIDGELNYTQQLAKG